MTSWLRKCILPLPPMSLQPHRCAGCAAISVSSIFPDSVHARFHANLRSDIAVLCSGAARQDPDPKGTEVTLSLSINGGGHRAKLLFSFLPEV